VGMMSAIWISDRFKTLRVFSVSQVGAINELSLPLLGLWKEVG
jgi:hypothetical protein